MRTKNVLSALVVSTSLILGVACSKKDAPVVPNQPVVNAPTPAPAAPVEKRKMLGMASMDISIEKQLRELGYNTTMNGGFYPYVIEENGKNYIEIASTGILVDKDSNHQLAPLSSVVYRFEMKINKPASSPVGADKTPQILEVGSFGLPGETIERGSYVARTSGLVITSLCPSGGIAPNYCKLMPADASKKATSKTIFFDLLAPRWDKACKNNTNYTGFCHLVNEVDAKISSVNKDLSATLGLYTGGLAATRRADLYGPAMGKVTGWLGQAAEMEKRVVAIKERTIEAVEQGKTLLGSVQDADLATLNKDREELIKIGNYHLQNRNDVVYGEFHKKLAKLEESRALVSDAANSAATILSDSSKYLGVAQLNDYSTQIRTSKVNVDGYKALLGDLSSQTFWMMSPPKDVNAAETERKAVVASLKKDIQHIRGRILFSFDKFRPLAGHWGMPAISSNKNSQAISALQGLEAKLQQIELSLQ